MTETMANSNLRQRSQILILNIYKAFACLTISSLSITEVLKHSLRMLSVCQQQQKEKSDRSDLVFRHQGLCEEITCKKQRENTAQFHLNFRTMKL